MVFDLLVIFEDRSEVLTSLRVVFGLIKRVPPAIKDRGDLVKNGQFLD